MIGDIRLQQFRSYLDDTFEFSPKVNIIVGPNASGKTNLLEAILFAARGSSYRAKDNDLIMFSKPWARLDAGTVNGKRTVKLTTDPSLTKTFEIADKPYKRLALHHTIPVVLFEPNHLRLLHGAPQDRRDYLDDVLEQTELPYSHLRRNYRRTLAQRNALLKRAKRPSNEELFPWNLRLSELGAAITRKRNGLAQTINQKVGELYKEMSGTKTKVAVVYEPLLPLVNYESLLLRKLEANLSLDIARGSTTAGAHREDFYATLDERTTAEVASRGETRTLVLALKTIELEILHTARGVEPILLLDDVFSELDGKRRHALTTHLRNYQTFITTTDADLVQKSFTAQANIIPLS